MIPCNSFIATVILYYVELIKLLLEHKVLFQLLQKLLLYVLYKRHSMLTKLRTFQKFFVNFRGILMAQLILHPQPLYY